MDGVTGDVSATLNYLRPGSKRNRLYVAPGGHLTTTEYAPTTVTVTNGRPHLDDFGLDRSGFALLRHTSAVDDFADPAKLDGTYLAEAGELVKQALGADEIVTLGARCVAVQADGDVASARFKDGSEIEADAVLGADGIHSAVRTSLFGPDDPKFTGKICYRSVIPTAAVSGSSPSADNGQWLGPHGTIVLYPLRGEELINVVCHYDDDGYRHESWITECSREEVLERYAGWHESLLRLFAAGNTWYKWALYDRDPIPQWTRGRVTLLGDAAHPMLPYLGQGACQALEDGAVLANALSDRRFASDPVAALASYELTRRPRASQVVLTARARGVSNHLPSRWAAMRRDAAIAVRRRLNRRDTDGRGAAWLADYDATSPSVLSR